MYWVLLRLFVAFGRAQDSWPIVRGLFNRLYVCEYPHIRFSMYTD